jgi:hypothetical protein
MKLWPLRMKLKTIYGMVLLLMQTIDSVYHKLTILWNMEKSKVLSKTKKREKYQKDCFSKITLAFLFAHV